MIGVFVPRRSLESSTTSAILSTKAHVTSLALTELHIEMDPCLHPDILDPILLHIHCHIHPLSELRRLDLEIKKANNPVTTANPLPLFSDRMQAIQNLEHLVLRNYNFLPQSISMPPYIPLVLIKSLEIFHCRNTGYLFNNMLSNYQDMRLVSLRITASAVDRAQGYVGEEKLHHFLRIYQGLEVLEICGFGKHSPK